MSYQQHCVEAVQAPRPNDRLHCRLLYLPWLGSPQLPGSELQPHRCSGAEEMSSS